MDRLRKASEIPPEPISWLAPGYIPRGNVTVVAGDAEQGKTLLGVTLATMATSGHKFFGDVPYRVMLNTREDLNLGQTLRPRFDAAGADLTRVVLENRPYVFPKDLDRLELNINREQLSGERLDALILDSAIAHIPGYTQAELCSNALEGLTALAAVFDIAVILVHHFAVKGARSMWSAYGGAYALRRVPRAVFMFADEVTQDPRERLLDRLFSDASDDGDDERRSLLLPMKFNLGSRPPGLVFAWRDVTVPYQLESLPALALVDETDISAEALYELRSRRGRADTDTDKESMVEQAVAFTVETLSHGPKSVRSFNAFAKEMGLSLRTVERARARASVEAIPPAKLKEALPDLYQFMPEEERRGWWLRLPPTPDTVPDAWE